MVYVQFFGLGKEGSSTSMAIPCFLIASRPTLVMSRTPVKNCMRWVKKDHGEGTERTYSVKLKRMRNSP
tara:strand:- start:34882 stop:35088 length:207 start_codon:yes stop_codon:yes gene_type:complete